MRNFARSLTFTLPLSFAACGDEYVAESAAAAERHAPAEPDAAEPPAATDSWAPAHIEILELGAGGIAILAYDSGDTLIGSITAQPVGDDHLSILTAFPRRCHSHESGAIEDCADILDISVRIGTDEDPIIYSNAPAELFERRAEQIAAMLSMEPQERRKLLCGALLVAAVGSCTSAIATGGAGGVVVAACIGASGSAFCNCDAFREFFPKLPWSELC
jgi:hypothetical protein